MAETTGIAWTDSTFNPWIGCTKVSPGCDHCYAEALDRRHRWGGAEHWGSGVPRLRTSPSNWEQPLRWDRKAAATGARRLVFCASLADVFDNEVPLRWRQDLLELIAATPNLTWLLLTKRIGNVAKMMSPHFEAPNVWLGASVVNQEEADRDIPKLLATPAAKRFVSYEPALGPALFDNGVTSWLSCTANCTSASETPCESFANTGKCFRGIDWLIVGGESSQGGAKARPFDLAWARSTVAQCNAAGVPVFVKQLGSTAFEIDQDPLQGRFNCAGDYKMRRAWLHPKDRAGADPAEWPSDLNVQEFPK